MAALFLASPACAWQQPPIAAAPLTAEQAISRQEAGLESALGIGCLREAGEIVVCAARGRGDVPFSDPPGQRKRLIPGEPASGTAALGAGRTRCSTVGPHQNCSGGIDVIGTVVVLYKLGRHLVRGDDE
jgi:hypothetical protein